MTIRLTDAQMTVLRALDKLPEGEWITAKEGGFSGYAAGWLACMVGERGEHPVDAGFGRKERGMYRLTKAGRALIANLKWEGKW